MATEAPPGAWREFGARLGHLRKMAGLSQHELAQLGGIARSTLGGYESGARRPRRSHVEALDRELEAHGGVLRAWEAARRTDNNPEWFRAIAEAEKYATTIDIFHSALIPGRFQIPEYARAVLTDCRPGDDPANIDRLVKIRTSMLPKLLSLNRPQMLVVLTEYVIRHNIGAPQDQVKQLDHLLRLHSDGTIRLLIVPSGTQNRAGVATGPFRLISFEDRLPMAYAEHASGGVIIDQRDEVRRLGAIFGEQMSWALTPAASLDLVKQVRGDLA
ncbi:helix-turn-helix domain-containing protein [Nocardiopsis sp. CA-288880]|uniref:helix-turn-helix domain-containing protein n=1 Tax=Nocardiopsis sp. CA-288880 TaxID=3239995 RepID=UPI003D986DF8